LVTGGESTHLNNDVLRNLNSLAPKIQIKLTVGEYLTFDIKYIQV